MHTKRQRASQTPAASQKGLYHNGRYISCFPTGEPILSGPYIMLKSIWIILAVVAFAGCTTQEKRVLKELENMPGVTCDVSASNGLENCGPDTIPAGP